MKHGGSYHGGGKKNNSGGGTQPKSGDAYTPLCRYSGYMHTEKAMSSKRASQYPHTSKQFKGQDAGSGTGGNVIGWMPE